MLQRSERRGRKRLEKVGGVECGAAAAVGAASAKEVGEGKSEGFGAATAVGAASVEEVGEGVSVGCGAAAVGAPSTEAVGEG
jgi:hypothetical protein